MVMTNKPPTPKDIIQQGPKTKEEIIEEFRSCFVDTEAGLDHAHATEIRRCGEQLIEFLTAYRQSVLDEAIKTMRGVSVLCDCEFPCDCKIEEAINCLKQL